MVKNSNENSLIYQSSAFNLCNYIENLQLNTETTHAWKKKHKSVERTSLDKREATGVHKIISRLPSTQKPYNLLQNKV